MVTLNTVFTTAYDTFKAFINSDVSDPKTGSVSSRRRWIYRDLPDTTSRNFDGYPFIVINHFDFNDDELITLSNALRENELIVDIEIHTEFDDPEGRCDTISGDVMDAIYTADNITSMQDLGLFTPKIRTTTVSTFDTDSKRVIQRLMRIAYKVEVCES